MIPPPPPRPPRQRGRPNTTRLLAAYLEEHGRRGYEEFERDMARPGPLPRRFEPVYRPPADEFDWGNFAGVVIVLGLLAGGLYVLFRALGWLS